MTFFKLTRLFAALLAAAGLPAQIGFSPARRDFPSGVSCCAVVGDFNGDDHPDLAMLSHPASDPGGMFYTDLTILPGGGEGGLQPPVVVTLVAFDETLISLAAADFNGDGKLDVALSAATGMNRTSPRVMVLLGNGDGTFQPPSLTSCTWGFIEVADFDGDGIADVLVWSDTRGSVRVSVLLGNGDGTLRPPRNGVLNGFGQFAAISCVAGDFDGDGKSDLAFSASSPGQLTVLMATGGGNFRVGVGLPAQSTVSLYPIGSGDFNADGKLDLIVGRGTGTRWDLHVIFGSGDGNFPKAVYYPVAGVISILSMAVLDFDRDGCKDLVLLGYSPDRVAHLFTYFGNGDGTFRLVAETNTGFADGSGFLRRFMIADFNGDGIPDAAAGGSGFMSIFSGAADGSFSGTPSVPVDGQPSSVVIADLDSDGKPDLAYLSGSGVSLMKGNGDGSFQAGVSIAPSSPGADTREGAIAGVLAVADLDGDGRLDVIDANTTSVSTMLGTGGGLFQRPTVFNAGGDEKSFNALLVADFNMDGKPDLANAVNGRIAILLSGGANGGLQVPPNYYKTPPFVSCYEGSGSTALAVGDFNGDGKPDIAFANEGVSILAGNGDGTFQPSVSIAGLQDILPVPVSLAVGDLDNDGLSDIAVTFRSCTLGSEPGGVVLLFGTGDGSFRSPAVTMLPGLVGDIKAADIDGDGKLDLVVGSYHNVTVLPGNGDGTFQAPVSYGAGEGAYVIAVGDVNGDGRPDIVTADFQTRGLSVLLNTDPQTVGSAQPSARHRFAPVFRFGDSGPALIKLHGVTTAGASIAYPVNSWRLFHEK